MPSTDHVTGGYTAGDAVSETPKLEERRSTRNRRPPQLYGDYVTH